MENWTNIVQAVASVASVMVTVIGFGFVYWQIRQAKNSIEQQNHASIYSLGFELNKSIIENSNLKPYLSGKEKISPDDPDYYKLVILTEMIADFYEYIICEKDHIDQRVVDGWMASIKAKIKSNHFLRDQIKNNKEFYSENFIHEVSESLR